MNTTKTDISTGGESNLSPEHGGLHCGEDFELSTNRGDSLAHLKQIFVFYSKTGSH